jgi:hypothetical protein
MKPLALAAAALLLVAGTSAGAVHFGALDIEADFAGRLMPRVVSTTTNLQVRVLSAVCRRRWR